MRHGGKWISPARGGMPQRHPVASRREAAPDRIGPRGTHRAQRSYEDNRAQYFLEGYPGNLHLKQWADAGVIGLLFGRGADGPTSHADSNADGVTNPSRFVNNGANKSPTNLGNVSQNSDDDGGYLRLKVRAYYAAGALALPGAGSPPPPPPPSADFTLALSPSTLTVTRRGTGTYTVTLTAQNGFASSVSLSSTTTPSLRGSRSFGTTSLTPPGTTTLSVSPARNAATGTYTLTVQATGGGVAHTATATLVVQ